jgi:hypothetical protein
MRTRGIVPASGTYQWRDGPLVPADESHSGPSRNPKNTSEHGARDRHDGTFFSEAARALHMSSLRTTKGAAAAGGKARMTTPVPSGSVGSSSARMARRRRFTMFLVTALPTVRDTARPTVRRPPSIPPTWTTTVVRPLATPRRITEENSVAARIREDRGSTYADRLSRPFRRRAVKTALPARVRIRNRKPCTLARRRLFGWNVRLLTGFLQKLGVGESARQRYVIGVSPSNPSPSGDTSGPERTRLPPTAPWRAVPTRGMMGND